MIGRKISNRRLGVPLGFRERGGDVSRLENFSDAVFAFAMTLLVVTLSVPKNIDALQQSLFDLIAFAICFVMLVWLWAIHNAYFRRFGLQDPITLVLNSILLFVVLFYVYPLKFMFLTVCELWFGEPGAGLGRLNGDFTNFAPLMTMYSIGFVAVFTLFWIMYRRALRLRDELELDELELVVTRGECRAHFLSMCVGMLSLVLAIAGWWTGSRILVAISGPIYFLMGPVHGIHGARTGNRVRSLRAAHETGGVRARSGP